MYRYSANNEIVYTPEDLILFRESPFASWMERLTLENPEHGIAPDPDTVSGRDMSGNSRSMEPATRWNGNPLGWEEFVSGVSVKREPVRAPARDFVTLLVEAGKDVVSIGPHLPEAERRCATTRAMRAGAQYIADGQLALGPMACRVDLLVRCDGVSEFGSYLYAPCATGKQDSRHTTHHLCFAADLLKSLQGVAPAELLIMQPGEDLVCLAARDHMPRFNELKYQFMTAQLSFRKHHVPGPAHSSHFGRWSRCARDVLARKANAQQSAGHSLPGSAAPVRREEGLDTPANSGEGLGRAMKRALASGAPVKTGADKLVDSDEPATGRADDAAEKVFRPPRYGRA